MGNKMQKTQMQGTTKRELLGLGVIVVLVALSRVLPHPPNFSPAVALGLLGGAYCLTVSQGLILVFGAMLLSDIIIGFHPSLPAVYIALALSVCIGRLLKENRQVLSIALATFGSSVLFFVITNFSAWLELPEYPKNLSGLMAAYTAAIPFFRNSLLGDVFYVALLFGGLQLLSANWRARENRQLA